MKTKLLIFFSIALISALTFTGCKKYPDGPTISLSSKKGRVANTWKFEKVFNVNTGADYTSNYVGEYVEFKKDGGYVWTDGSSSDVGTWSFASDKEDFIMTENGSSSADTYHIRRLKGKEFWIRRDYSSSSTEYHLSPR